MQFRGLERVVLLALWAGLAAGCTAAGAMIGSEFSSHDPRQWGQEIPAQNAIQIDRGTPIQVNLPDSGYVRGIWLGLGLPDSTGPSPHSPVARIGVGNRIVLDAQFSSGQVLKAPTRDQVPDTLRFPLDRIDQLRAPSGLSAGAKTGAAVGAAVDATIVLAIAASVATLVWLIKNFSIP